MLLGEMLLYRYRLITKDQRDQALAEQQGPFRGQPLGQILLHHGLITETDLRQVLDDQNSQRDPWHGAF